MRVYSVVVQGFFFEGVLSAAFSDSDQFVFTGSQDRTVKVWDVSSGTDSCGPTHKLFLKDLIHSCCTSLQDAGCCVLLSRFKSLKRFPVIVSLSLDLCLSCQDRATVNSSGSEQNSVEVLCSSAQPVGRFLCFWVIRPAVSSRERDISRTHSESGDRLRHTARFTCGHV